MDPKNDALKRRDAGEEEPIEGPQDHNYCSVSIGSHLGPETTPDAYRIERKLGWGTCSTIWLALDTRCGEYVALKIMTYNVTSNMLSKKRNQIPFYIALDGEESAAVGVGPNTRHTGRKHCMHLLEAFIIDKTYEDERFEYAVCAFEVLGPDLTELQRNYVPPRIPVALVKLIVKQTLQALDYIHEECGIVHCDLRPDHISLRIGSPILVRETVESLMKMKKPEFLEDGRPVSQPLLMHTVYDEGDVFVKLTDFGNATWRDKPHRLPSGPLAYRSPEALLEHPDFGPATDIWSLGCIIFELLTGKRLFEQYDTQAREEDAIERHLMLMRGYSQQFFPDFLREESFKGPRFLGTPATRLKEDTPCLRDVLNEDDIFSGDMTEMGQVEAFIKRCLILDPRYRPTAIELLKESWLND